VLELGHKDFSVNLQKKFVNLPGAGRNQREMLGLIAPLPGTFGGAHVGLAEERSRP
jgi:hypothetical protein